MLLVHVRIARKLRAAEARGAEQAYEDDSSRYSEGGDLVNGLFWTRGEMTRSRKGLKVLAPRTGVEPVSPP
jgi:hypothetical protein